MDYYTLGKEIKNYRKRAGITQERLAEMVDCSNTHIGQIENAGTKPSLEMIVKIANALNVTLDQLLNNSYAHPENLLLKNLSDRICKYPPNKRMEICEDLNNYLDSLERFNRS